MKEVIENSTLSERALSFYLVTFSVLALVLAAVGVYGLLAYSVAQRRREIGIRMALGAGSREVAAGILRHAGKLTLFGVLGGAIVALFVGQGMRSVLYGVKPAEPLIFLLSGGLLLGIALAASWIPACRATKVNPVEALRTE